MVQTPTRANDASMEMMAVRIMTQPLFPRIFPGVCPYCVCFIELQGHCIFGQCTDTKVQGALAQTAQLAGSLMETKGLHNPHRSRKTWIATYNFQSVALQVGAIVAGSLPAARAAKAATANIPIIFVTGAADMMFGKDRAAITHAPNFFLAARRRLAVSRLSSL
jgi:exosortase/archaeosortase